MGPFMENYKAIVRRIYESISWFILLIFRLLFILPWPKSQLATFFLYLTPSISRLPLDVVGNNLFMTPRHETLVLIHGWTQNGTAGYYDMIAREYQKRGTYNIICVDWSPIADSIDYASSALQVPSVGNYIAWFLMNLQTLGHIQIKTTIIIGHSLGGQVAANIGKELRETLGYSNRLKRIDALDAAGPFFEDKAVQKFYSLSPEDAEVVTALHTTSVAGVDGSAGTIDFYANGGSTQPGCAPLNIVCSHARSYDLYAESINSKKFIAKECRNGCSPNATSAMYGVDMDPLIYGNWNLDTNEQSPYAKG